MNGKRRFPLKVKDELLDFTLTQNVWLTVNNTSKRFYRLGRSSDKFSLRLGIDLWEKRAYDYEVSIDQLRNVLEYDKGIVKILREDGVFYYIGACDVPFKRLEKGKSVITKEGDVLIALDKPLDKELLISRSKRECDLVADQALSYLERYMRRFFRGTNILYMLQFLPAEKYTFFIQATLGAVGLTTEMFRNKLITYHCPEHWHIEMVIHEALVNAITYGSQLDYTKKVAIGYEIGPEGLRVFIHDQGEGFDVKRHVPVSLIDRETITGRGIRLMKNLATSLVYNKNGNAISLLFNFKETLG
ncbi:ATP-binding protein [Thermospira aquatica]|uniref:ATP-binding protein n=1 Tax=Thermospira aquatica TaxID=2828656 RepID=A0AAX3BBV6_9SPIR|nr:ATP-binding protein [Thermospira aquatica]URA09762.1 ATP-binding protein [Thermospira aquatica]